MSEPAPNVADAPAMFLFPGLRGDGPDLGRLRQAYEGRFRFELIDHPGLACPADVLLSVAASGRIGADAIARRQPVGDLMLLGFSFGGCVALEAARHLAERGRRIAFLSIVDAPFCGVTPDAHASPSRLRGLARDLLGVAMRIDLTRRLMVGVTARLAPKRSPALASFLIGFLRRHAIALWRPRRFDGPGVQIVMSGEFAPKVSALVAGLIPDATRVVIGGAHAEAFGAAWLDAFSPAFDHGVAAAMGNVGDCPLHARRAAAAG